MAIAPLTGINIALRRQISRDLNDAAIVTPGFFAALRRMDYFYKTPGTRFRVGDGSWGDTIQFDFMTGIPAWTGIDAVADTLANLVHSETEAYTVIAAKMGYSSYHCVETIRKAKLNRLAKSPKSALPWIEKTGKAMADGLLKKLEDDAFPAANMVDNATTNHYTATKICALAYPLQDPAGGNYEYADLNLNAYTYMKATVAGDTSTTPFGAPTASNIRRKLLMPLQTTVGGLALDLGVCDSDVFDFMISEAEDKVRIDMAEKMEFGGVMVRFNGLNWMPTARMDALAAAANQKRELYVLSSKYIHHYSEGSMSSFDMLDKIPDAPTKVKLQGFVDQALVNEYPRAHGRAVDVVLN